MKTAFKIEDPNEVSMTLTVTMTLAQWRALQSQLQSKYPSWKLSSAITEMVHQATNVFSAKPVDDDANQT